MIQQNIKYSILFLTLSLTVIDIVISTIFNNFYIYSKYTLNQVIATFILSLIISFTTKRFRYIFSIFLLLLNISEIIFFSFFRAKVEPYHFEVLFSEIEDILNSLYSIIPAVSILVSIFIVISYILFKLSKIINYEHLSANILITIIVISLIIYSNFRVLHISSLNFSYINMLYSLTSFIGNRFKIEKIEFKPYIVKRVDKGIDNVILIVGESLSSKRMQLFGYKTNNTPNLNRLKSSSNFYFEEILSGGINTPVSIVTLFTQKREPQNIDILKRADTNLIYLADKNGFNTYWLSMQDEGMSISSVMKYAKHIKVRKDYPDNSFDEVLIDELKDINWSRKNFVVIHLRANHSPYEKYIPKEFRLSNYNKFNYFEYKVNSYSDSIRYVDYLLGEIFNYFKNIKSGFKIYFVSDHGERLGYKMTISNMVTQS